MINWPIFSPCTNYPLSNIPHLGPEDEGIYSSETLAHRQNIIYLIYGSFSDKVSLKFSDNGALKSVKRFFFFGVCPPII
jgi:hypothetical protein